MQFIRRWIAGRRTPAEAFPCPHCGADVPLGRRSCPHCGASESDGWSAAGDFGEPDAWSEDSEFDYDSFVQREFGESGGEQESGQWKGGATADPKRLILWLIILAFAASALLPLLF